MSSALGRQPREAAWRPVVRVRGRRRGWDLRIPEPAHGGDLRYKGGPAGGTSLLRTDSEIPTPPDLERTAGGLEDVPVFLFECLLHLH